MGEREGKMDKEIDRGRKGGRGTPLTMDSLLVKLSHCKCGPGSCPRSVFMAT